MIELRQLLFNKRISQQDVLCEANYRCKKRLHQSRISQIMNGVKHAQEWEKNRIRLALDRLGIDENTILKVRELVAATRED